MSDKTWVDVHKDETFSDNSKACEQCKDCKFREIRGFFRGHELGYAGSTCKKYDDKPLSIMRANEPEKCKYKVFDDD